MPAQPLWLPHLKLQFGGNLGNPGLDQWTNSLRFRIEGDDVPDAGDLQEMVDAAVAPLTTWFTSDGAQISSSAKLNYAKLNWITANGTQREQTSTPQAEIAGVGGGIVNFQAHWHDTFAITLRTALRRGRGHAGRIFPPAVIAFPQGNSPYISSGAADAMAGALVSLITSLKANWTGVFGAPDIIHSFKPVVASAGLTAEGGNGGSFGKIPLLNDIVAVVVDRVCDVQHRRTNRVPRLESNTYVIEDVQ